MPSGTGFEGALKPALEEDGVDRLSRLLDDGTASPY